MQQRSRIVLKVGGGEVDNPQFLKLLAALIADMAVRPVIVHGGGKDITRLLEGLGVKSEWHQGLRITDDAAIEVVEMALSGLVNKRIVGALEAGGVRALGVSGRDLGLVRAAKLEAEVDLGHVGEAGIVNSGAIKTLAKNNWVPVISPVSQDKQGFVLNINADHVARAVAVGLKAEELVFVSNVPCIYDDNYELSTLKAGQAETLITSGVIDGGMIPKVRSGISALEGGVKRVVITDIDGFGRRLNGEVAGTVIEK
jgi:acetylglutamate kinase